MVPNMANIAKNHFFPKNCHIFGNIFMPNFTFFDKQL